MDSNQTTRIQKTTDKKLLFAVNLFWLGFFIYTSSSSISSTGQVNYVVCNIFQILGLFLLLPASVFLIQFRIESNYLKILLILYCCWILFVIVRGISFDYESLKQMLFDTNYGIFLYFVPLILLFPSDLVLYKRIFTVIIIFSFLFILYDILFMRELLAPSNDTRSRGIIENFSQHLGMPSGFILLTFIYHKKRTNLWALFVVVLMFLISVIRARRGIMFISFTSLIFIYIVYQYVNRKKFINIIISLFAISILSFAAIKVYTENRKDTFSLITERFAQRTRNQVEQYFYQDLKPKDWIIGKGMNGTYFCPGVEERAGILSIYRRTIETGYLQIVLAGGIFELALILLMAIPAIFLGLFYSRNLLSKASAIWIIIFVLYLYPGTPTIFSLNYFMVWISIGICYSKKIREYSDSYILNVFKDDYEPASIM